MNQGFNYSQFQNPNQVLNFLQGLRTAHPRWMGSAMAAQGMRGMPGMQGMPGMHGMYGYNRCESHVLTIVVMGVIIILLIMTMCLVWSYYMKDPHDIIKDKDETDNFDKPDDKLTEYFNETLYY